MGTEANILFDLEIENTLFVSKNGNDATGERGNWNQPFATLFGATALAVAGDCVFVYAGTYDEADNDWVKSDVRYFFNPSTLVIGLTACITDGGIAKNIIVEGYADFQIVNVGFGNSVLTTTNPASVVSLKCNDLIGVSNGIAIIDALSFNIKVRNITVTDQYGVTIRGNCFGSLEFDTIENFSTSAGLMMRNLGTDLVSRTISIKGKRIITQTADFGQAVITHINTNNTKVIYSDFEFINTNIATTGGLFFALTTAGASLMRNVIGVNNGGYGIGGSGSGSIQLSNCDWSTVEPIAFPTGAFSIYATDSFFKQTNSNETISNKGVFNATNSVDIDLDNCFIYLESISLTRMCLQLLNNNVRLSYCKLITSALQNESIGTGGNAQDIIVEGQCSTNRPTSGNLTNIVAGTSIIVDSNIGKNTNNFL
jgi:hypothetical protein